MSLPVEKGDRFTYADILAFNDEKRYELYEGKLTALAAPSDAHQRASREIFRQIANYLVGKRCEVFSAPFDVRLFEKAGEHPKNVDTVVQPDIIVVCDPDKVDRHGIHGAPDLVIEILSESTRRSDRKVKYRLYQQAGVPEYWIVDPASHMVAVHLLENGLYSSPDIYLSGAAIHAAVLDDCTVDLSMVFPR